MSDKIEPVAGMYVNYLGECEEIQYGWGPADVVYEMQPLYTADALAQARAEALEEAAKLCENYAGEWWERSGDDAARSCAFLIRALKEQTK